MHWVYGAAIWTAIAIMLGGLSMLFGIWPVLAVAGGIGLAGATLYSRRL